MKALYSVSRTVSFNRVLRDYRAVLWPLGLVLAVNLVVLVAVVWPLSQSVASNERRAEAAERQRATAEAEFRQAEALRDGKSKASSDLETFYSQILPVNTAAARRVLQLKLQQQARAHAVSYQSGGATEEAIRDSALLRLTMQMRLSGEYDDIRGFIYEIETSPDFLVIDNLKLAEGTDQSAPLSVYLEVSTYYRASPGAPVPTSGNGR